MDRRLTPSAFPADEGRVAPATRSALAAAQADPAPGAYLEAVAALCADRVLVPVVARATRVGSGAPGVTPAAHGLPRDKEAEMAVVLLRVADGRRALLGFTGLEPLRRWEPSARPVPVTLDLAARSALQEGAGLILVDVAGPHPLVIETELLGELAAGRRLVRLGGGEFGWAYAATR